MVRMIKSGLEKYHKHACLFIYALRFCLEVTKTVKIQILYGLKHVHKYFENESDVNRAVSSCALAMHF